MEGCYVTCILDMDGGLLCYLYFRYRRRVAVTLLIVRCWWLARIVVYVPLMS